MNLKRLEKYGRQKALHIKIAVISVTIIGVNILFSLNNSQTLSLDIFKIYAWPIYKSAVKNMKLDSEKLYVMRHKKIDQEKNIGQN